MYRKVLGLEMTAAPLLLITLFRYYKNFYKLCAKKGGFTHESY